MPYVQPTVSQLQPLGRRDDSTLIVVEEVDAPAGKLSEARPPGVRRPPRPRRTPSAS